MLKLPHLARCADRTQAPLRHPTAGGPEEWLSADVLGRYSLVGVTFDFFVNWKEETLSNALWLKFIVNDNIQPWPPDDKNLIQSALESAYGHEQLRALARVAHQYDKLLSCILFKESDDWNARPGDIVVALMNDDARVTNLLNPSLEELKARIRGLSGGPVHVGHKGLIYGTSTLECHLSRTDAAWPGDVDLLLVNNARVPLAIIEFKKHTLDRPIEAQRLANYYPTPDRRKYDRLAILGEAFGNIPLIILYYPTKPHIQQIKIERIEGPPGGLETASSEILPLPEMDAVDHHTSLLQSILDLAHR